MACKSFWTDTTLSKANNCSFLPGLCEWQWWCDPCVVQEATPKTLTSTKLQLAIHQLASDERGTKSRRSKIAGPNDHCKKHILKVSSELKFTKRVAYQLKWVWIKHNLPILDVNYDVVQILFGHSFGQLNQSLVKVCEVLVGRFNDGNSAVGKQLLHFRFDRIEIARQQVRLYHISSMQSKG